MSETTGVLRSGVVGNPRPVDREPNETIIQVFADAVLLGTTHVTNGMWTVSDGPTALRKGRSSLRRRFRKRARSGQV